MLFAIDGTRPALRAPQEWGATPVLATPGSNRYSKFTPGTSSKHATELLWQPATSEELE
jgi:hypothetical protein